MLIDKTEISKHRELSRGVRDDKINPYIQDAEMLDLKPLLGSDLFYDMVENATDPKYVALLEPVDYKHTGLNKVLSLFAYARYVLFGSFTDTAFGFVQKSTQDSQPVGNEFKRNIHTKDRQAAMTYFSDVVRYIEENKSDYPLWGKNCGVRSVGNIKISKITR